MIYEDELPSGYPYDAAAAHTLLRHEINNIIHRYGQESDVTVYQAIGVLEIVKLDLVALLDKKDES